MEQPLSPWSKEDLKQLEQLDAVLSRKAEWHLTTAEVVQLYRSLLWLSSLKKKIEDSSVEILAVKQIKKQDTTESQE